MSGEEFTLVKNKKRTSKTIPGMYLEHTYKMKDNWDGNFCSDYCIGCGACDHFPTKYAVLGYEQSVRQLTYYCKKCDDKRKNSITAWLLDNDDENKNKFVPPQVDIELREGYVEDAHGIPTITCGQCEEHFGKDMYVTHYSYYTRILCECCGKKLGIKKMGYLRCDDMFWCGNCETNYKLDNWNKKTIMCEQISKLKEYRSKQLFVSVGGEISKKQVVEKLE